MEKKHIVGSVAILALLAGVGWAIFQGEDAEVLEAKQMRDELLQKADTLSPEERRAEFESLREKTRDLSDEQRREVWSGMRRLRMQQVDRLLAMPKEEQNKELDKWIDRMEEMRKNREANGDKDRKGRQGKDGGRGGRGGGGKGRLDRSSPEMRGKMDAMKDLINDRRAERGLEPMKGPGMFRGRPR